MQARTAIKRWLPPVLLEYLKPLFRQGIYFSGRYPDWETARARSSGYQSDLILERVKQATLKVKTGAAAYERDSVLFDRMEHSFPVLAGLLRAAVENGNQLSMLDFGGALGSSYFQCRGFLSALPSLRWCVVEQEHFVGCGRELFADGQLQFFSTISECLRQCAPNAALLSSVLQYLPEPFSVLDELMDAAIPWLVIDRTPFADTAGDCITVQHVPPSIYAASYPCRVFARQRFLAKMNPRYEVVAEFDAADGSARIGRLQFKFGGMILHKR